MCSLFDTFLNRENKETFEKIYWRKRTDKNITKKCLFHHNKSHAHKAYFVLHQKRIRIQQENKGKTKNKSDIFLVTICDDSNRFFIFVDHHFGKARLNLYWRTLSKYHHTSVMESVALAVHFIKYPLYSYHFPLGMRNIFEIRTY